MYLELPSLYVLSVVLYPPSTISVLAVLGEQKVTDTAAVGYDVLLVVCQYRQQIQSIISCVCWSCCLSIITLFRFRLVWRATGGQSTQPQVNSALIELIPKDCG